MEAEKIARMSEEKKILGSKDLACLRKLLNGTVEIHLGLYGISSG